MDLADNSQIPNVFESNKIDRMVKNEYQPSIEKPNTVDFYLNIIFQQSINALNLKDKQMIKNSILNLSKCMLINSEIAKKITFEQVQLMINLTKTYGIKFSSLVFEFLRILLDCYDELIPLILKEHNFILFAISKIPMDTAVDFLVQLLQYSNNNNIPDSVNLTKYFIENNYHHNLMKLFNSMIKFPHQQAQILKILKQLETIQNYPSDLYVNFIEHCQRLLEKLKFNEEDQIPLFEYFAGNNNEIFLQQLESNKIYLNGKILVILDMISNPDFKHLPSDANITKAVFNFMIETLKAHEFYANQCLNENLIHEICKILQNNHILKDVKLSAIDFIIELSKVNYEICTRLINTEFSNWMKNAIEKGSLFDRSLSLKYIISILKYSEFPENIILDWMSFMNPINIMIEFLNSDKYDLITGILTFIQQLWDVYIKNKRSHPFLSNIIELMHNEDFKNALNDLVLNGEDDVSSTKAQKLLQYMKDQGIDNID